MVANKLYRRILAPPPRSFFLFGPRGVGKSTWARKHFRKAHRIDLLDESVYQDLLADPSLMTAETENGTGAIVIADTQAPDQHPPPNADVSETNARRRTPTYPSPPNHPTIGTPPFPNPQTALPHSAEPVGQPALSVGTPDASPGRIAATPIPARRDWTPCVRTNAGSCPA